MSGDVLTDPFHIPVMRAAPGMMRIREAGARSAQDDQREREEVKYLPAAKVGHRCSICLLPRIPVVPHHEAEHLDELIFVNVLGIIHSYFVLTQ